MSYGIIAIILNAFKICASVYYRKLEKKHEKKDVFLCVSAELLA